ncbi:MAG: cellulose synthase subunit BcsC-related outer membrane protein [Desulfobacterales bacterium]|jgi:Flp pilus assembly protein TadD|nr:cellulose synthase subunit BcsC-related outer membrane protein [Desulfobacterales bacterium]
MTRRLLFLTVWFLLAAAALPAPAQVRQEPLGQTERSLPPPARQSMDEHSQAVIQRRSGEEIETWPQQSLIEPAEPDWEYRSPEDADILEGWTDRPAAGPLTAELSGRAKAWQLYARGNYSAAARLFAEAVSSADREEALNARLGLAYSLLKQGKRDPAIPHLAALVDEKYRPAETIPALLHALIQSGRWMEAKERIAQLPHHQRPQWERRLLEARLLRDYRALPQAADPSALAAFLEAHDRARRACIRPDIFHEVGNRLAAAGARQPAVDLRRELLECPLPPDLRLGIVSELAAALADEEALALVRREKPGLLRDAPRLSGNVDDLELQLLKRRLAALQPDSELKARAAEEVLKTAPADRDALTALAWHRFRRGEFEEAERRFAVLSRQDPTDRDVALGLGYARLNSGRIDTALDPLDRGRIAEDAETRKLRELVYRQQAARAYAAEDWDGAAVYLEKLLSIDPGDRDAQELLAWTRLRQDRRAEARALMEEGFAERPSPSLATGLLGITAADGDEDQAFRLAERLADDEDPALRAPAGDFFFERGAPVTAAQLDRDPQRCYFNADSQRAEVFLYHRSKQGEGKFGDIEETALPLTFVHPTELGRQWSASITPRHLSGNSGPARPQAGRYYRLLDGGAKRQDLEDSLFVVQPDVGVELEGRLQAEIHVGTTPLNGPVDPTPTFEARLGAWGGYVDVHRCNVKDSILSYVGQKDPYSNDEWGRVTRNGIAAGKTWPLASRWWVSGAAGYDYYMGDSVWDNQAVHLDASVGRTLLFDEDEFSYGLFFSVQHFRRNSDFYTYGHGGYYSPDLMTMIGPFVRYRTAACRDYWFDVQTSAGWLHQRLDRSPFYPLFDGDTTGLTPAAAADANGEYDSDTDNKIGFNLRLQGMKQITSHLAAGGFASVNNSADYTEWSAGVGIQIFFEPQNRFWTRKDMFREFGTCSNK